MFSMTWEGGDETVTAACAFVKRPSDIDRQIDFTRAVSSLDIYYIILFVIKTFA